MGEFLCSFIWLDKSCDLLPSLGACLLVIYISRFGHFHEWCTPCPLHFFLSFKKYKNNNLIAAKNYNCDKFPWNPICFSHILSSFHTKDIYTWPTQRRLLSLSRGRTYLVGEGVILVWDQQDGRKKRQISTPVSAFSAIVDVSLKCVL